jgi:hypothetical protein
VQSDPAAGAAQTLVRGELVIFSVAGCVNEPEIVANALRGESGLHYGHHLTIHAIISKLVVTKNHNLGANGDQGRGGATIRVGLVAAWRLTRPIPEMASSLSC